MYLGPNCKNVEFGGSKIIITPIDYKLMIFGLSAHETPN